MAHELNFVASSPILAKILNDTQQTTSIADLKTQGSSSSPKTNSPNKEKGYVQDNEEDTTATFSLDEFIKKLQASPKKEDFSEDANGNIPQEETAGKMGCVLENGQDNMPFDIRDTGNDDNNDVNTFNKPAEKTDYIDKDSMAWSADSHGFYQPARTGEFLLRFSEFDKSEEIFEETGEPGTIPIGGPFGSVFNPGRKHPEIFVQDECMLNEKPVNGDKCHTAQEIPLVFIQAPTPSDLSRCSSSIGSSRAETPESFTSNDTAKVSGNGSDGVIDKEAEKSADDVDSARDVTIHGSFKDEDRIVNGNDLESEHDEDDSPANDQQLHDMYAEKLLEGLREEKEDSNASTSPPGHVGEINEACDSLEQTNNSLMTSWSEQQLLQHADDEEHPGDLSFVRKTEPSPIITWETTVHCAGPVAAMESLSDEDEDLLSTTLGSVTDLREILERADILKDGHGDCRKQVVECLEDDVAYRVADSKVSDSPGVMRIHSKEEGYLRHPQETTGTSGNSVAKSGDEKIGTRSAGDKEIMRPEGTIGGYDEKMGDKQSFMLDEKDGNDLATHDDVYDTNRLVAGGDIKDLPFSWANQAGQYHLEEDTQEVDKGDLGVDVLAMLVHSTDSVVGDVKSKPEESNNRVAGRTVNGDDDAKRSTPLHNGVNDCFDIGGSDTVCEIRPWEVPLIELLNGYHENMELLTLGQSIGLEQARLGVIKGLRSKMEDSCNQIPIEKIPSFVYGEWRNVIEGITQEQEASYQQLEADYEENLRQMRSELDMITRENFDLSKTTTEINGVKLENELLRKQVGGLNEYICSLERRIEGKGKENAKMLEDTEQLENELAARKEEAKRNLVEFENKAMEMTSQINDLKIENVRLENDLKVKDIECKRLLSEKESANDEIHDDLKKMNANTNSLRNKVMVLHKENETLRTANEADQTVIKHLESKLEASDVTARELRTEKSKLLAELQQARVAESDLRKEKEVVRHENLSLEKQKENLAGRLRLLNEEKKSVEQQLNIKLSEELKSTDAMLRELKSLESSLNSARKEKSLLEDKYNNQRFELERVYSMLKAAKHKKGSIELNGSDGTVGKALRENVDDFSTSTRSTRPSSASNTSEQTISAETDSTPVSYPLHSTERDFDSSHALNSSQIGRTSQGLAESSSQLSVHSQSLSTPKQFNPASLPVNSDNESVDSYFAFPTRDSTFVSASSQGNETTFPDVVFVKSPDSLSRNAKSFNSPASSQSVRGGLPKRRVDDESSKRSNSYSADDTRSWLRSMETKLEQTDQIIKSMKKSKHVHV